MRVDVLVWDKEELVAQYYSETPVLDPLNLITVALRKHGSNLSQTSVTDSAGNTFHSAESVSNQMGTCALGGYSRHRKTGACFDWKSESQQLLDLLKKFLG